MKIFVINLKRSTDRKKEISEKLEKAGIRFEIFEGVEGELLERNFITKIQENATQYKRKYGRPMLKGEIGAAFSHLLIYKKIIEEKIDLSLVLEDDIDFDDRLEALLKDVGKLSKALKKFELVLLGYCVSDLNYRKNAICSYWQRSKIKGVVKFGVPVIWYWAAIGYLIKFSAAEKLVLQGECPSMQADYLTANSPSYGINLGISIKPIIWPGRLNEFSTIGKRSFEEEFSSSTGSNSSNYTHKSLTIKMFNLFGIEQTPPFFIRSKKLIKWKLKLFYLKISWKKYQYIRNENR